MNKSEIEKGWTTDPHPHSTEKIIDYLIDLGLNPGQLVIGAAFYGRAWKGVSPDYNGLYQLSSGTHKGWFAYKNIREQIETDSSYQRYWDDKAKAAYFYNKIDSIMISYDDTVSVRLKMEYATEKGLGGLMFWQLGSDTKDGEGLLDAIHNAVD